SQISELISEVARGNRAPRVVPPCESNCSGKGGDEMETLPKFGVSRAEMMKRVARFNDLKGSDGGLPDSTAPHCDRTLYNVIGFQPPDDESDAVLSPVGDNASRMSAIPISEGFNLGYCRAKPGKGPMMHNHDTNETFIPMTGVWRCSWENEKGEVESIDLNPLDVISFPPGAIRRFENIQPAESGETRCSCSSSVATRQKHSSQIRP